MSRHHCTYISTLAGSLALPDGECLPHCTEEELFTTRVQELMGQNGIDSGTAPFKYADIQALTSKSTEPATQPPPPKPAQPQGQNDLRKWAFDTNALKTAFAMRHKTSSSSHGPEPSPSPSPPRTNPDETVRGDLEFAWSASKTAAFLGKASGGKPSGPKVGTSSEETITEETFSWTDAAAAHFFGNITPNATGTHHGGEESGEPKECEPAEQKPEPAEQTHEPGDCNPSRHPKPTSGEHEEPTNEGDGDREEPCEAMDTDRTVPTFADVANIKALLCIADPWCGLVATGEKTWELRFVPTAKRR
eukprot:s2323_g15.t1